MDPAMLAQIANSIQKADVPGLVEDAIEVQNDPRFEEDEWFKKLIYSQTHLAEHAGQAVPGTGGTIAQAVKFGRSLLDSFLDSRYEEKQEMEDRRDQIAESRQQLTSNPGNNLARSMMSRGYDY